jgi:hypothetical protein
MRQQSSQLVEYILQIYCKLGYMFQSYRTII